MPAFRWSAINGGASAPSWGSFSDRNRTGGAASAVRSCAARPSNNSVPVPTFFVFGCRNPFGSRGGLLAGPSQCAREANERSEVQYCTGSPFCMILINFVSGEYPVTTTFSSRLSLVHAPFWTAAARSRSKADLSCSEISF